MQQDGKGDAVFSYECRGIFLVVLRHPYQDHILVTVSFVEPFQVWESVLARRT